MSIRKLSMGFTLLCSLAAPTTAQELPKWLIEAKAREAKLGELTEVSSTDGWLKTKVPGSLISQIKFEDGSYSASIRLADEVVIACRIIKGDLDLANSMRKMTQTTFGALEKIHGVIDFRAIEITDAGVIGDARYLEQHWIYRANQGSEVNAGTAKILLAARNDASVYCINESHGYRNTFRTAVEAIISNLHTNSTTPAIKYQEFHVVSINNARAGAIETSLTKEASGVLQLTERDSILTHNASGNLTASDSYRIEWTNADGVLLGAQKILISNGSVVENIDLKLTNGRWAVAGVVKEKQVQATLPYPPSTFIEVARGFRRLLLQPKPEGAWTDTRAWISLDLTRLTPMKTTIQRSLSDTTYASTQEIAGLIMETVLDKNDGTIVRRKRSFGSVVRIDERIHQSGSF